METPSHRRKKPLDPANLTRDRQKRRKALLSGCVGSSRRSVASRPGSISGFLRTQSSKFTPSQNSKSSQNRNSWNRGLLNLKRSCVCEGVIVLEEFKLRNKHRLSISTKKQTRQESKTKVPEFQERISAQLGYFLGKACQTLQYDLFFCKPSKTMRGAEFQLEPEEHMIIQASNKLTKLSQSSKDHHQLGNQSQIAMAPHDRETFGEFNKHLDIDQETIHKFFLQTGRISSKLQNDKSSKLSGSTSNTGRAISSTEIMQDDQLCRQYNSPSTEYHSAELSSSSSLSSSGHINFEGCCEDQSILNERFALHDSKKWKRSSIRSLTASEKARPWDSGYCDLISTLFKNEHILMSQSNPNISEVYLNYMTTCLQANNDRLMSSQTCFYPRSPEVFEASASSKSLPAALFHSPTSGRRSFYAPGSTSGPGTLHSWSPPVKKQTIPCFDRMKSKCGNERVMLYSNVLKHNNAWRVRHVDEVFVIKASKSNPLRKLEPSFGDCRLPSGLHKSSKEFHGHAKVEASKVNVFPPTSSTKRCETSADKFPMSASMYQEDSTPIETSSYASLKADTTAKIPISVQGTFASFDATSGNVVSSLNCSSMAMVGDSKETPYNVAIRHSSQASQDNLLLPTHKPLTEDSTLQTKSPFYESVSSSTLVHGQLECLLTDKNISFKFNIANTKEILIAEASKDVNAFVKGANNSLFTFWSCIGKGKKKTGCKQWGQKQRSSVKVLGEMQVTIRGRDEIGCDGTSMMHTEADFVLLGTGSSELPTDEICPNSNELGLSLKKKNFFKESLSAKDVGKQLVDAYCSSMFQAGLSKSAGNLSHQYVSKNSGKDHERYVKDINARLQVGHSTKFKKELSAMMIRLPSDSQKKVAGLWDNTEERTRLGCDTNLLKPNLVDLQLKDIMTIILPAGEHGCPSRGSEGPQPLIQRWESGGKCDCGSWDLGCGLVILKNEQSTTSTNPSQTTDSALQHNQGQNSGMELFIQGRIQKVVTMSLAHLHGSLFSLSFQEPMSSLQAFAAAVAKLCCRLKPAMLLREKQNLKYVNMMPARVIEADPQRCKAYSKDCLPDLPVNPVDRV